MKSREFASVSFVVVGLLFFAQAMLLLQTSISFIELGGQLLSIVMLLPTALLLYLGFYIIHVRDRLAVQVLPEQESADLSPVSKREFAAVAFAAVGLLIVGIGFPGTIEITVEFFAVVRSAPAPSVMGADSGLAAGDFLRVLPEASRFGTQTLFGLLLVWLSPRLAARFTGPHNAKHLGPLDA